jgi:hypothetical protein
MAGKAGQPCESPTTRELDQAAWETGHREGKKEYDKEAKDARDKAEFLDMEEFNEPKPANPPPVLTTEPMFDSLATEVDSGPLSVLSDSAKDRIKAMIHIAMEDGYNRGYKACECDWHIADSNRLTRLGESESAKGRLTMSTTGGASPK